ncbi:class I SAM-dependent methyltransferase [Patescibacteria group bacterium]|nr:class I SAM-dependent methyltransferase [Patescibacteria group bacterium]
MLQTSTRQGMEHYWETRYQKFSLNESGIKGLSTPANQLMYNCKIQAYQKALRVIKINRQQPISVLDIGCGQGFFANYCGSLFPRLDYLGIDISRKLINHLSRAYPQKRWKYADVTQPGLNLGKKFNIVQLIDLPYLITDDKLLRLALANSCHHLKHNGSLFFTDTLPTIKKTIKDYIVFRPISFYKDALAKFGFELVAMIPIFYCFPDFIRTAGFVPASIAYYFDRLLMTLKIPQLEIGHDSRMALLIAQRHG